MIDQDMEYPSVESGSAGNQDAGARTPYVGARRRGRSVARLALALAIVAGIAAADEYPTHPIRLLVGFPAGGGLDISCRHWAQRLSTRMGQQVVVENRPGASGELAVRQAMASKPDGYTLVCLSGSNTISSSKPNPPFDILNDVVPVIQMTRFTFALYVNPSLPVKSLRSSSRMRRPSPGNSIMARSGRAPRHTSPSSYSRSTPGWTSCTFHSKARHKPRQR